MHVCSAFSLCILLICTARPALDLQTFSHWLHPRLTLSFLCERSIMPPSHPFSWDSSHLSRCVILFFIIVFHCFLSFAISSISSWSIPASHINLIHCLGVQRYFALGFSVFSNLLNQPKVTCFILLSSGIRIICPRRSILRFSILLRAIYKVALIVLSLQLRNYRAIQRSHNENVWANHRVHFKRSGCCYVQTDCLAQTASLAVNFGNF